MEQLFDEGEIFGMLKDFNGDKALGPDGKFAGTLLKHIFWKSFSTFSIMLSLRKV